MTAVECRRNSAPYCRQVSGGVFTSTSLTGKNSSVGLRRTWYTEFTINHTTRMTAVPTRRRTASGAARSASSGRSRFHRNAARARRRRAMEAMGLLCLRRRVFR